MTNISILELVVKSVRATDGPLFFEGRSGGGGWLEVGQQARAFFYPDPVLLC